MKINSIIRNIVVAILMFLVISEISFAGEEKKSEKKLEELEYEMIPGDSIMFDDAILITKGFDYNKDHIYKQIIEIVAVEDKKVFITAGGLPLAPRCIQSEEAKKREEEKKAQRWTLC